MRSPKKIAATLCLAVLSSCTTLGLGKKAAKPHVSFVVPSAQAPYDERLAAYEQLRPETERKKRLFKTAIIKKRKKPDAPLTLADGTQVYHSEDLAPLVPPDSVTAQAIERHLKYERSQKIWASSAIGLSSLSGGAFSLGLFVFVRADDKETKNLGLGFAIGGIVLSAVSLAVSIPVANARAELAQKANEDAFVNYDQALRVFLGICERDGKLVDCYSLEEGEQPIQESLKDRLKKRFGRDKDKNQPTTTP